MNFEGIKQDRNSNDKARIIKLDTYSTITDRLLLCQDYAMFPSSHPWAPFGRNKKGMKKAGMIKPGTQVPHGERKISFIFQGHSLMSNL